LVYNSARAGVEWQRSGGDLGLHEPSDPPGGPIAIVDRD
jgi:hypothetical protein